MLSLAIPVNPTPLILCSFVFVQDYDSGLRALIGRERYDFSIFDLFFTHTNFVIGSKLPAYYSFMVR